MQLHATQFNLFSHGAEKIRPQRVHIRKELILLIS